MHAQPQKIKIDVAGIPLNKVFFDLRDKFGFQFTFNDRLLSDYKITASREFETKDAAVSFLLEGLPLEFEKNGDVFVIFSTQQKNTPIIKKYLHVGGQVVEADTFEPLPFSYILINNRQVQSDQNGNFNFLASADASIKLQISHLGYFVYDTVFTQGLNHRFILTPSVKELGEVKVEGFYGREIDVNRRCSGNDDGEPNHCTLPAGIWRQFSFSMFCVYCRVFLHQVNRALTCWFGVVTKVRQKWSLTDLPFLV